VEESAPYVISQSDLGQKVTLSLASPISLNANESYLAVVGSYGDGGATNDLVTASSGSSTPQTSFYFDYTDNTWYYTTSNVMVRMNFNPALSIENISQETGLSVFPNPASNEITVQVAKESIATFSILDSRGTLLGSYMLNGLSKSIDITNMSDGIYFILLTDGKSTSTKKIVINK
jgi:hypothetical protein